jgi:hypothetical protein
VRALENGEMVTIIRPGPPTQDEYGNDVPGAPVEIEVPGCAIAPRDGSGAGSNELTQARDTVIVGLTVYAPAGTDLRSTDQMRVRGELYEVDGEAGAFRSPFTGASGPVVAALRRVTG